MVELVVRVLGGYLGQLLNGLDFLIDVALSRVDDRRYWNDASAIDLVASVGLGARTFGGWSRVRSGKYGLRRAFLDNVSISLQGDSKALYDTLLL